MVDHHNFHRTFARFQLQPQLFLHRREERRTTSAAGAGPEFGPPDSPMLSSGAYVKWTGNTPTPVLSTTVRPTVKANILAISAMLAAMDASKDPVRSRDSPHVVIGGFPGARQDAGVIVHHAAPPSFSGCNFRPAFGLPLVRKWGALSRIPMQRQPDLLPQQPLCSISFHLILDSDLLPIFASISYRSASSHPGPPEIWKSFYHCKPPSPDFSAPTYCRW